MIILGLTGGIASGKTTSANIMKEQGAIIIDTDIIAHSVIEYKKPAWYKIINYFGNTILNNDNTINRLKLGEIVFNNKDKLNELNKIVHPYVLEEVNLQLKKLKELEISEKKNYLVVLVIPLLFELKLNNLVNYTLVISCKKEQQLMRLQTRNNFNKEEAEIRIKNQLPMEEKIKLADFVIYNDSNLDNLKYQLTKILKKWKWDKFDKELNL